MQRGIENKREFTSDLIRIYGIEFTDRSVVMSMYGEKRENIQFCFQMRSGYDYGYGYGYVC